MVDLQTLLKTHGPELFYAFLVAFGCESWNYYADSTGIRITVIYRPVGVADKDEYEEISTDAGFVLYRVFASSIRELTRDFDRFTRLKAFL